MDKPQTHLKNELDTFSYSLGVTIGQNLKSQGLDSFNIEIFSQALHDLLENKDLKIKPQDAGKILNDYFQNLQARKAEMNKTEGLKFLQENAKKEGVVTLPSGLQYKILKQGTGPKPGPSDKVTTHYHGTLINGTVFDSSVERGDPATFPVNGVIAGWTEALQLMPVGSKWRLFIPPNLAYGERGAGGAIGPNSTLIFDVELLSIEK